MNGIIIIIVLIIGDVDRFILKEIELLHSHLHSYQGVERKSSVAEDTFPVETNTHCRMSCHLKSRLVLGRMDNCPLQRSEHHLAQTLYIHSDNGMLH